MFVFKCLKHNYQVTKTRIVLMIYRNKESLRKMHSGVRCVVVELEIQGTRRTVEVILTSYHSATDFRNIINRSINTLTAVSLFWQN